MAKKTAKPEAQIGRAERPDNLLSRHDCKSRSFAVLLAWQAGELTEMEASKISGVKVIDHREQLHELLELAKLLSARHRQTGETLKDDLDREVAQRCGYKYVPGV